jgi:hypothetical protein
MRVESLARRCAVNLCGAIPTDSSRDQCPGNTADKFGHTVALSGDRVLIGAPTARGSVSGHSRVGVVYDYGFVKPLFFSGFE